MTVPATLLLALGAAAPLSPVAASAALDAPRPAVARAPAASRASPAGSARVASPAPSGTSAGSSTGGPADVPNRDRRWSWPVGGRGAPAVLRGFEAPSARWNAGHRGVDLAADAGEAVRAVDDGVVAFAGSVGGRGTVSVDHAGGLRSTYEPVVATVRAGASVRRGDVIGRLAPGATHCPGAVCLHVGAASGSGHGRTYVDPLTLFGLVHPVLLPLREGTP